MAVNSDSARYYIQKLNGNNYELWQHKVKMLLMSDDLWSAISDESPKPDETEYAAWKVKNNRALTSINMLVEDNQIIHIINSVTAKEAWNILKEYNQRTSYMNIVYLQRKLFKLYLTEGADMEEHITEFLSIVNKLKAIGRNYEDEELATMLLCSLPESYDTLVTTLEGISRKDITLDLVKTRLIGEYQKRKNQRHTLNEQYTESAMKVSFSAERECFWCKRKGHFKRECKDYQDWKEKREKANFTKEDNNKDEYLFHVSRDTYTAGNKNIWILDSGAASHYAIDRQFFDTFHEKNERTIMPNGQPEPVTGEGSGTIKLLVNNDEQKVRLERVSYAPTLVRNILSMNVLSDKGFDMRITGNKCVIMKKEKIVATATKRNGYFILDVVNKIQNYSAKNQTKQVEEGSIVPINMRSLPMDNTNSINKIPQAEIDLLDNEDHNSGEEIESESEEIIEEIKSLDIIQPQITSSKEIRSSERGNKGVPPHRFGNDSDYF